MELYEMPCSMFQVLYAIAYEKMQSEQDKIQADALEDAIEEAT